jgi:hypothetical protein
MFRDPIQPLKLLSGSLKKYSTAAHNGKSMPIKTIIRIPRARIKIRYVWVVRNLYQRLHKLKADKTCLSNTMVNCCCGKLCAYPVKTIHSDVCQWPEVSNTAGTRKACQDCSYHIVLWEFQALFLGNKKRRHRGKLLTDDHSDKLQ